MGSIQLGTQFFSLCPTLLSCKFMYLYMRFTTYKLVTVSDTNQTHRQATFKSYYMSYRILRHKLPCFFFSVFFAIHRVLIEKKFRQRNFRERLLHWRRKTTVTLWKSKTELATLMMLKSSKRKSKFKQFMNRNWVKILTLRDAAWLKDAQLNFVTEFPG